MKWVETRYNKRRTEEIALAMGEKLTGGNSMLPLIGDSIK